MTSVIAVLLGRILVAMISSNQAAAKGVWKVVKFALIGAVLSVAWAILIGYAIWFYSTYPAGEWERIMGIAVPVFIPPILIWLNRNAMVSAYKKNKKAAFKSVLFFIVCIAAGMVIAVVFRELKDAYQYSGWVALSVLLAVTGNILLWRTLTGSKGWREVWFGPPAVLEPWQAVLEERLATESARAIQSDEIVKNWGELSEQQQEIFEEESRVRMIATEARLSALSTRLEAEKVARTKNETLTVMGVFWLFLIFAIFGLIGVFWDIGFAYALELKFVKGIAWLAGVVVIGSALVLGGLIIWFFDTVTNKSSKKV